jgi:isopentenyl diphosphate isomerase/L-lactate dehydrogenase-like FMN-dependent dehydrogenase
MILSYGASVRAEEVLKAGSGPMWSQLYGREKFEENLPLVESAQAAGFQAIVLTVDQTAAYYERVQHTQHLSGRSNRGGRSSRGRRGAEGDETSNPYHIRYDRLWYNWPFIERIRPYIKVPFLAKGILTPEDARMCVESGLDGIIVSNHGGRQFERAPAPIEVLPGIVEAAGARLTVMMDSGISNGVDMLIAFALGAKFVFVGRATAWGLIVGGLEGTKRSIEILKNQADLGMAQIGCRSPAELTKATLLRVP